MNNRPLAMLTGASAGIGYELGRCCAENGFDLLIAADQKKIHQAAEDFRALGADVQAVEVDLATAKGVDDFYAAARKRPIAALLANAGHGLGNAFLDQNLDEIQHVVDTNISGTIRLVHHVGREMRARGAGRMLITGSIAGFIPGTFTAVYNGTKAFVDNFSIALRAELENTGVTVTCLMPGATDTEFFERAGMLDTAIGQDEKKDDPAMVARVGFTAMMQGDADVVTGWKNRIESAVANITPATVLAERHRAKAEPGSGHT